MAKTKIDRHLLRRLREERGWSKAEAAEALDISRQGLDYIERGMTQPRMSTLLAMARVYGVSTDALCGLDSASAD